LRIKQFEKKPTDFFGSKLRQINNLQRFHRFNERPKRCRQCGAAQSTISNALTGVFGKPATLQRLCGVRVIPGMSALTLIAGWAARRALKGAGQTFS
jgi:hypothetical protein